MISVLVLCFVASATAAPQFSHSRPHFGPQPFFPDYNRLPAHYHSQNDFGENIFDTNKFWDDMAKQMKEVDDMLAEISRRFSTTAVSQQGIDGSEYKITIPLTGFEEKDIVVKAREGLLMIQACHEYPGGTQKNYLEVRNLPDTLVMNGTWIYDKSILKIVFPLKEGVKTVESVTAVSTDFTTKRPTFNREEIEDRNDDNINENVDVGLDRGDLGKDREIVTNFIPDRETVEATTYAVDLKDEVEFVPVRY